LNPHGFNMFGFAGKPTLSLQKARENSVFKGFAYSTLKEIPPAVCRQRFRSWHGCGWSRGNVFCGSLKLEPENSIWIAAQRIGCSTDRRELGVTKHLNGPHTGQPA